MYEIERGGDVTYHGPGQLMFYPILNLNYFKKDIHWFLRSLEKIAIDLLGEFGILANRVSGSTGVWLGNKKIASVGIAVKNWISYHGIAINIKRNDLENFSLIRPCGMDVKMTSLESQLHRDVQIDTIKAILINKFNSPSQNSFGAVDYND
jgi:lipoate-protein ligase B